MKYLGSCHCKAVQFELETETIRDALQCNCSICRRKNAIMSKQSFSPKQFTLLTGKEKLTTYRWGDKDVNHYFCRQCGIYPFHDTRFEPEKFRINLGCIDNLDLAELTITHFDGKHQL